MATMDITPQELRDIEIREAWRGYHRDDVDELLERAAATIEHLQAENQDLRRRGAGAPAPSRPAAPGRPAAAPQPAPAPVPVPVPVPTPDNDVIQRTLLLAQRAADEAVSEATARAAQIVAESEGRAQALVAEAEASARRIAEAEKARLEEEIRKLLAARETLTADVDALTRFEQEFRERLRRAIEAELETLAELRSLGGPRPQVSDLDLPAPTTAMGLPAGPVTEAVARPDDSSWSASREGSLPAAGPSPSARVADAPPAGRPADVGWDPVPAGGWEDAAPAADFADEAPRAHFVDDAPTAHFVDDSAELHAAPPADSLDDDAFFASLREAVRDDAPLGPGNEDDTGFFDQDDITDQRGLFKRRR